MPCSSGWTDRFASISMRCAEAWRVQKDSPYVRRPRVRRPGLFRLGFAIKSGAVILLAVFLSFDASAASGRRVTVRTDDGVTLAGTYFEASRRPAPGIVLLPMLMRNHDDWQAAASRLADAGYAVLAIDFRSAGEADAGALELDVRAAKAFLRERPDVMPNVLGMAGASLGANMAVIDAADDPTVRSIALLSPGLDYRGIRTEVALKKFGARAALIVSSTKDPYAWRSARTLAAIGPGTREMRLSEARAHGTALLQRDPDLIGVLVDWFRKTLV
jgi:dienelactone hydrolase